MSNWTKRKARAVQKLTGWNYMPCRNLVLKHPDKSAEELAVIARNVEAIEGGVRKNVEPGK